MPKQTLWIQHLTSISGRKRNTAGNSLRWIQHLTSFSGRKVLGFVDVIFVNSVILSFVALRTALSKRHEPGMGEEIFELDLSLCPAASLVIVHVIDR